MIIGTLANTLAEREKDLILSSKKIVPSAFFRMAYNYQRNSTDKNSFDYKRAWKIVNSLNSFSVVYTDDSNGNIIIIGDCFIHIRHLGYVGDGYISRVEKIRNSTLKAQLYIDGLNRVHLLCFDKFRNPLYFNNMNTFNKHFKRLLYELPKKNIVKSLYSGFGVSE